MAFAGVALHQVTGNQVYDGLASVAIAVLLAGVAVASAATPRTLLIGEAADARGARGDQEIIEAHPGRRRLLELLTMALAPDRLLVAARVDLADGLSADEIERASSEIDRELRERIAHGVAGLPGRDPRSEVAQAEEDRQRATGA